MKSKIDVVQSMLNDSDFRISTYSSIKWYDFHGQSLKLMKNNEDPTRKTASIINPLSVEWRLHREEARNRGGKKEYSTSRAKTCLNYLQALAHRRVSRHVRMMACPYHGCQQYNIIQHIDRASSRAGNSSCRRGTLQDNVQVHEMPECQVFFLTEVPYVSQDSGDFSIVPVSCRLKMRELNGMITMASLLLDVSCNT